MEEIGIPKLTSEQMIELCEIAEEAARTYVLSKVSSSKISVLNITVDTQGIRPLTVNIDVEIVLSPIMKNYDVKKLTIDATKKAFASLETYLRELKCESKK